MELDLPLSPPPVEDLLAQRRAKRLAILAKYSSAGEGATSQSQSPSSAVQPPPLSSSVSDPVPPTPSTGVIADGAGTPAAPSGIDSTVVKKPVVQNGSIGQCSSPYMRACANVFLISFLIIIYCDFPGTYSCCPSVVR